ncbi:MAG: hypothetical protein HN348_34435, partial [Proteobacteria bacterium]|nr:hypothetical protein [Pseudomonadota bacterium]
WFYSRSRQELWHKGATSGNFLKVVEVQQDCDGDAIVVQVNPVGPACHTGTESCFDSGVLDAALLEADGSAEKLGPGVLQELLDVINQRVSEKPEGSYTVSLIEEGPGRVAQKVVEEAGETAQFDFLTPADIPSGATLVDILEVQGTLVQRYTLPEGGSFTIAQGLAGEGPSDMRTPSSESQSLDLRGTTGQLFESQSGDQVLLTWSEGELFFSVAGDLTAEQALAITESLE